jgi:hypothetical protein
MFFEKRNDATGQVGEPPDAEAPEILSMIVVPAVPADVAASEVPLQRVQNLHTPSSLNHRERWLNLPARSTRSILGDRHAEAALTVDEADDPLRGYWPFLLIVRTGRIFTAHHPNPTKGV